MSLEIGSVTDLNYTREIVATPLLHSVSSRLSVSLFERTKDSRHKIFSV